MPDFEIQPLTEVERQHTAARVLSDAEFIRGGAAYNEFGGLVITDAQLEKMQELNERYDPQKGFEEVTDLSWLNDSMLRSTRRTPEFTNSIAHILTDNGIENIRDILVVGRHKIGQMRKVGPLTISAIEQLLGTYEAQPEWHEKPTIEYVASISKDLTEVNGYVIDEMPIAGSSEGTYRYRELPKNFVGLSVNDILVFSEEECGELATWCRYISVFQIGLSAADIENARRAKQLESGRKLQLSARDFAEEFETAKTAGAA